jgi:uncharacterized protein YdeI (YjbR/CyaY-like superfamily)
MRKFELPIVKIMNPKINWFFEKEEKWHDEVNKLRTICLACPVEEALKWGNPCYSFNGSNIVLIHVFKEYAALLFFKGSLLGDPNGILIQQTENVQVPRQARFTSVEEIAELEAVIKSYIYEAIEVEKAGIKAPRKTTADFPVAEEFQAKLDEMPGLKTAFDALTPGRQRGYLLHFSQPKQSKTREARVDKYIPQIMEGKGIDD